MNRAERRAARKRAPKQPHSCARSLPLNLRVPGHGRINYRCSCGRLFRWTYDVESTASAWLPVEAVPAFTARYRSVI